LACILVPSYSYSTNNSVRRGFLSAVERGNITACEQLLQETPNLPANRDHRGDSVLHKLAMGNCVNDTVQKALSLLMRGNPNLEASNATGQTPLMVATRRGKAAIVSCLLQMGANVKAKDAQGQTVLHLAAMRGDAEITRVLLRKGAENGQRNRYGRTASDEAQRKGYLEITKLLSC
ncbi:MAG: ankyrin repeat domain-containing protein, partial [Bacteroidota bacterium]